MINSVMPKGVEHVIDKSCVSVRHAVINSVMPKGVEHYRPTTDLISDKSD